MHRPIFDPSSPVPIPGPLYTIKPVAVSRTIYYTPESYLEYCAEYDEEPTQDGFIQYIQDWIEDDFTSGHGEQDYTELV